jgi:hypothetical protein
LQDFLAGGIVAGCRPPVDRYRPPSKVLTANRLHENLLFCRSFSSSLVIAVGAVDIASPDKIGAVVSGCQERGLIVGKNGDTVAGFNNIVTLAPPLNVTDNDMEFIAEKLAESVKAVG